LWVVVVEDEGKNIENNNQMYHFPGKEKPGTFR